MKKILLPLLVISSLQAAAQSVDMLTGRLQMSVPLAQLQANDISIPISIYHHGGTLKVAESNGDCGLGWNMGAANFGVTRTVRGLPDELNLSSPDRKGWLHGNGSTIQSFTPQADDDLSDCTNENNDFNALDNLAGYSSTTGYSKDTEPDLFSISAPGLSAQFVLDGSGNPRLLTHQDIIIQLLPSATLPDSIIVYTNSGMRYSFRDHETKGSQAFLMNPAPIALSNTDYNYYFRGVMGYYQGFINSTSQWKLNRIYSATTGTAALFYYSVASAIEGDATKRYRDADSSVYVLDVYMRQRLDSVKLKSYTAKFTWGNPSLSRIEIKEKNSGDTRNFRFEYAPVQQGMVLKQFLSRLVRKGGNCQPDEYWAFAYWNVTHSGYSWTLPSHINWTKNWGQDFFGFPNGASGNKNLPTLYKKTDESDGKRLMLRQYSGFTEAKVGQDRLPNAGTDYAYGALWAVEYPTGGTVEIQYEVNSYYDPSVSSLQESGPGLRVKKLISQGGQAAFGKLVTDASTYHAVVKEYEYKFDNDLTSGVLSAPPKLGYLTQQGFRQAVENLGDEPIVLYSRVREKISGQGSTLYEFSLPGVYPETTNGDWKATRSKIARPTISSGCVGYGDLKNGSYTFPFPPATNYDFKRGQLAKVTDYNESGAMVREKAYTYTAKTSDPQTIKGIKFERIKSTASGTQYPIYHYGVYEILTGRMEVVSQEVVKEASHEDLGKIFQTTTAYSYNSNHMLETVTTTLPNSTTTVRKMKYAKDFQYSSPADAAATALKSLNDANRTSELVEQITKVTVPGSSEVVTDAQLVVYKNFGSLTLPYQIKIAPPGAAITEASVSGQSFAPDGDYMLKRTMDEYDGEGRITTSFDDKRQVVSYHYATDPAHAIATVYNARYKESVFENFESASTYGLAKSGSQFQTATGWTGAKALAFTGSSSYLTTPASMIRNGDKYRVSCWAYSTSSKQITFNAKGGGNTNGVTLPNNVTNTWNYLEGEITLSTVTTPFTLEVSTNAGSSDHVLVDDVIFMPASARISHQTVLPLTGPTSSSDDRGNSVKITYDDMGRELNTLDRNRNLVKRREQVFKNTTIVPPSVGFTRNTEFIITNGAVTFTATPPGNCESIAAYTWKIDGNVMTGSGSYLTYTFTTAGTHTVSLTATSLTTGSSAPAIESFCVEYPMAPESLSISMTDVNGPAFGEMDCNSPDRTLTVNTPSFPGCTFTISWTVNGQPLSGTSIVVSKLALSQGAQIEKTYVATVTLKCPDFGSCIFRGGSGYTTTLEEMILFVHSTCL